MVLCAGTNDIFAKCGAYSIGDLKNLIPMAQKISPRLVFCTAYEAAWRPRRSCHRQMPEKDLDNMRRHFNTHLTQEARRHGVQIPDLDATFAERTGRIQNVPGTLAIEICLSQLLSGEPVVPPPTDDPRLFHLAPQKERAAEIQRQKDRQKANCPNLWLAPVLKRKKTVPSPCPAKRMRVTI